MKKKIEKDSIFSEIRKVEEAEKERAALLNILEDVEEARGKAEEEKDKTQSIITNLTDGLLVLDSENKFSLINPQAEEFFNIKNSEVVGKTVVELAELPKLRSLINLLSEETKGIFRKELSIEKDLTVEVSTVSMMRGMEKTGTMVILHDVTREKLVEKMKTEFVSISAHQLRTPLSVVKWTLKMLLDGDLGKITDEQREFIEKTYKSNERMIALINDLLNVTRIEEGRYLYKPVLTDLQDIVQSVINSYQEEIKKRKLRFEFKKLEGKLPKVTIDAEKMNLVIQNLLENAIRYTPPDGAVTISLTCGKEEIEFKIQDTGVGIPKDQQERIFTKFFRGANIIRIDTEGSGFGLYITKNIIESHGGKIWFESEENKGSTFYFTLPLNNVIID